MLFASHSSFDASGWRWPHFTARELACRCGGRFCRGEYWHDAAFLDALEKLREAAGRKIVITSAHRCPLWNALVGGAPASMHKTIAVDVSLRGHGRWRLLSAAERCGFNGIGLARSFIYLDRRANPARWFYAGSRDVWEN